MHLSRGHTNSNVISSLPFTESADLKSVTHLFLLDSALFICFQGEIARLMKYKSPFWVATA